MAVKTKTFVLEDEGAPVSARVTVTPGSYFEFDAEWGVWSEAEIDRLSDAIAYYRSRHSYN